MSVSLFFIYFSKAGAVYICGGESFLRVWYIRWLFWTTKRSEPNWSKIVWKWCKIEHELSTTRMYSVNITNEGQKAFISDFCSFLLRFCWIRVICRERRHTSEVTAQLTSNIFTRGNAESCADVERRWRSVDPNTTTLSKTRKNQEKIVASHLWYNELLVFVWWWWLWCCVSLRTRAASKLNSLADTAAVYVCDTVS